MADFSPMPWTFPICFWMKAALSPLWIRKKTSNSSHRRAILGGLRKAGVSQHKYYGCVVHNIVGSAAAQGLQGAYEAEMERGCCFASEMAIVTAMMMWLSMAGKGDQRGTEMQSIQTEECGQSIEPNKQATWPCSECQTGCSAATNAKVILFWYWYARRPTRAQGSGSTSCQTQVRHGGQRLCMIP